MIREIKQPNDWLCKDAEERGTGWNEDFYNTPAFLEMVVKINDKTSVSHRLENLRIGGSR